MKVNFFYSSLLKYVIWLTAFKTIVTELVLSDVNKDCIAKNNGTTSNDYLLGTWFKIYQFHHLGPYPTCSCLNVTFNRPTNEEIRSYREKYNSVDLPNNIGEDAVVVDRKFYTKGLLLGNSEAKTYILDSHSAIRLLEGYEVHVYKRINNKYMLFWQCCLRGHVKWLLTRDQNSSEAEMQQIIRDTPEITHKNTGVRYCNGTCY
ncbi:hypothetical protein PYW08_003013 [Mythimna loreyi]|uniref:Uncharacterized protein n=1 Tax=Mythimna loreyi TaxID=667449 RepID=A0ACC2QS76_9NEOP|nr:hypothetical protein PYW08_003013 [Mythimna loreyi]